MAVKGTKRLIKRLQRIGDKGETLLDSITFDNATEIEQNAKKNANSSLDTGKLKSNIQTIQIDKGSYSVITNATGFAPYSAYVEFGTGGLVEVPKELQDVAIQFKGRGIKKINLPARPYLYPAFVNQKKKYIEDLENGLEKLLKT